MIIDRAGVWCAIMFLLSGCLDAGFIDGVSTGSPCFEFSDSVTAGDKVQWIKNTEVEIIVGWDQGNLGVALSFYYIAAKRIPWVEPMTMGFDKNCDICQFSPMLPFPVSFVANGVSVETNAFIGGVTEISSERFEYAGWARPKDKTFPLRRILTGTKQCGQNYNYDASGTTFLGDHLVEVFSNDTTGIIDWPVATADVTGPL